MIPDKRPFKSYVRQWRVGGGVKFPGKKRYKGVSSMLSALRGSAGVNFPGKKRYVTLELR